MLSCPFCVSMWVDHAIAETGMRLTALERRRLIAALLSRRHLILSGPAGIGKRQLANELALCVTKGQQERVCRLQGHPWWATETGNVGLFVDLQTSFSAWRLAFFAGSVLYERLPAKQHTSESNHGSQAEDNTEEYMVCVEDMSRFEIELYYRVFAVWLFNCARVDGGHVPIRLIGTYDSDIPPVPDDFILDLSAVLHLSGVPHRSVKALLPRSGSRMGR